MRGETCGPAAVKQPTLTWSHKLAGVSLAIVALWVTLGFLNWHELVTGVRVGIPRADNSYGQHLLFDGPVQILPIIAAILLHACAAVIGYATVVRPIWGGRRLASQIWLLAGGLIPGSLFLIAISRIVSLALSNAYAPSVLIMLIATATGASILKVRHQWNRNDAGLTWRELWPAGMLLVAVFIFTIQIDRFHIVGEASSWFINEIYLSPVNGIGTAKKFPLVSQHYDEAALLYPVIYGLLHRGASAQGTLSFIYWIMVSLGRMGVGSLIYISLRSLGVDRLSAIVSLAFVSAATLSVNPISSRLLFNSLSPLAYALHIARFLIPVMPLLLVSALAEVKDRSHLGTLIASVALGLGLSAMPIHALMVLAWALPVIAIAQISPAAANAPGVWRAATIAASGVLVAFMLTYSFSTSLPAAFCIAILLAASVMGTLIVVGAWCRSGITIAWRAAFSMPVILLLMICAGYGVGLLLLGNIFITRTDPLLSHFWPWWSIEIADRAVSDLGTSSGRLLLSPYCSGYYWEFRNLAGHCSSLPMLVRSYGLAFAMMAGVIAWWAGTLPEKDAKPDRTRTMILCAIFLCLIAMPISFVGFDFVAPTDAPLEWQRQLSIWLRSRLVEPWFYGGILLSLAFFLRDAGRRTRRWMQSAMLAATAIGGLAPFLLPGQVIIESRVYVHGRASTDLTRLLAPLVLGLGPRGASSRQTTRDY